MLRYSSFSIFFNMVTAAIFDFQEFENIMVDWLCLSNSYLPLFLTSHHSSHLLSFFNFLIQRYQSSTSIVLCYPLILNHFVSFSMTSVLFSPLLQPHLMNSSSPATLTCILIILHTLSPLSFFLSISLNMSTSLPTTKVTFSSNTSLALSVSLTDWFPSNHFPVFTRMCITQHHSLLQPSLFLAASLHTYWISSE